MFVAGAGLCSRFPKRLLVGAADVFRFAKILGLAGCSLVDPKRFVVGAGCCGWGVPKGLLAGASTAAVEPKLVLLLDGWEEVCPNEKRLLAGFSAGACDGVPKLNPALDAGGCAECCPKLKILFAGLFSDEPPKLMLGVDAEG